MENLKLGLSKIELPIKKMCNVFDNWFLKMQISHLPLAPPNGTSTNEYLKVFSIASPFTSSIVMCGVYLSGRNFKRIKFCEDLILRGFIFAIEKKSNPCEIEVQTLREGNVHSTVHKHAL